MTDKVLTLLKVHAWFIFLMILVSIITLSVAGILSDNPTQCDHVDVGGVVVDNWNKNEYLVLSKSNTHVDLLTELSIIIRMECKLVSKK